MRTAFPPTDTDPSPFDAPHFYPPDRDAAIDETARYETAGRPCGTYSAAEVAALPTDRIVMMSRTELMDVIRAVRGRHLRPGVRERLPQMDGETLRRLVFLTRRYCRNQQLLADSDPHPNIFAAYCG